MDTTNLLDAEIRVINLGLESFADELRARGVPVVQVEWTPPAGGDREILDLLAQLGM